MVPALILCVSSTDGYVYIYGLINNMKKPYGSIALPREASLFLSLLFLTQQWHFCRFIHLMLLLTLWFEIAYVRLLNLSTVRIKALYHFRIS